MLETGKARVGEEKNQESGEEENKFFLNFCHYEDYVFVKRDRNINKNKIYNMRVSDKSYKEN